MNEEKLETVMAEDKAVAPKRFKKTSRKKVSEETVESKEDIIADEVIITGVDTVPEGEEIIDEVIIDATEEAAKDIEDSLILDEEPLNKEE